MTLVMVRLQTRNIKIMQDNHAWNLLDQLKHVRVEVRVSKVVQHAIELTMVSLEPVDGSCGAMG